MAPNCSAITYSISSNNCGDCLANTTSTTTTCRELQLTSNMQTCELHVQTIVCDRIAGIHCNPLITMLPPGTLYRPVQNGNVTITCNVAMDLTPMVKIFPKYQQNTTLLISFMTVIDKIVKSDISNITVNISALSYICRL